jgi:hypothetical protein
LASVSLKCTTDHDQLAERPSTSTSAGGATGTGGAATTQSLSTMSSNTASTTGRTFEYTSDGDDVLTLVHGQVDARLIAFCFAPSISKVDDLVSGSPQPAGGLVYGAHASFREPGGLSLSDDIVPIVLAGDSPEDFELDCADALREAVYITRESQLPDGELGAGGYAGGGGAAGGSPVGQEPDLRAMQLPRLVEGTLQLGRHYVMVIAGCMGGTTTPIGSAQCGPQYAPGQATLRPLLVPVSRDASPFSLSLQFMHASAATPEISFRSNPASDGSGSGAALATSLTYGVATFEISEQNWSTSDLGVGDGATIEVLDFSQNSVEVSWQDAASLGGAAPLQDGESYLLILLGPRAGLDADGVNPATVSVIPTGEGRAP